MRLGSDGPGRLGARGAAAQVAGARLRGGEFARASQNGAPVHGLVWDLVQELENGTRDPPVCSGRGIGARDGVRGGGAGLCGGARRCACVRAVRGSGPSAGESAAVRRAKGKPRRGPGVVVRG